MVGSGSRSQSLSKEEAQPLKVSKAVGKKRASAKKDVKKASPKASAPKAVAKAKKATLKGQEEEPSSKQVDMEAFPASSSTTDTVPETKPPRANKTKGLGSDAKPGEQKQASEARSKAKAKAPAEFSEKDEKKAKGKAKPREEDAELAKPDGPKAKKPKAKVGADTKPSEAKPLAEAKPKKKAAGEADASGKDTGEGKREVAKGSSRRDKSTDPSKSADSGKKTADTKKDSGKKLEAKGDGDVAKKNEGDTVKKGEPKRRRSTQSGKPEVVLKAGGADDGPSTGDGKGEDRQSDVEVEEKDWTTFVPPSTELECTEGDGTGYFSIPSYEGHRMVLYFYPKDNTPGCTACAKDFEASLPAFDNLKIKIFGVSRDSVKSHQKFKEKAGLSFELVADPNEVFCHAFGVMKRKRQYGKEALALERSTFVIAPNGRVEKAWRAVQVRGHVDQVLSYVKGA